MNQFKIYMEQAPGFVQKDKQLLVCLLLKSLYGLHQAPRDWNSMLHEFLTSIGFKRNEKDYGLYMKTVGGVNGIPIDVVFITLYVDDMTILGEDEHVEPVEKALMKKFDITSMGELKYLLGIEIHYEPEKYLFFSQKKFVNGIIEKFGNKNMHAVTTPQVTGDEPTGAKDQNDLIKCAYPYRQLIGALQYVVSGTRLELAYTVRTLAKYTNCYTTQHWSMAIRVLRYLVGTINFGLTYNLKEAMSYESLQLDGWSDSDWGTDKIDRKSITGYVTMLNGQTICAKSLKQDIIASSTCEAELIAASTGSRDIVFMEQLLDEMNLQHLPSTLHMDNEGAATLCKHPSSHKRSKHYEIRHLICRQYVEERGMNIQVVKSNDNVSDLFTKPLPEAKFIKFREAIHIKDFYKVQEELDDKMK